MGESKVGLGPTGETVSKNVKRLRGRMTYKELSELLSAAGRPIPVLGLRRIEAGERRVDADDLVALALALGVTPNALLLEPAADEREVSLTGIDSAVSATAAWLWADGHEPLWKGTTPTHELSAEQQAERQDFYSRTTPRPDYSPEHTRQMKSEYSARWREAVGDEMKSAEALAEKIRDQLLELQALSEKLDGHGND